jgi:hypothetical protein
VLLSDPVCSSCHLLQWAANSTGCVGGEHGEVVVLRAVVVAGAADVVIVPVVAVIGWDGDVTC